MKTTQGPNLKFISPKAHLANVWRTSHAPETRAGWETLDRNERTIDFPPEVMAAIRARISPFLLRACPEPEGLYRKLAAWLEIGRDQLLLSMGSDAGMKAVYEVFVEGGEEVVSLTPSYAMFPVYAGMVGALAREVRFNDDLTLPLSRILEAINDRTKLVILANPNQPIERIFTDEEIITLLEACSKHNALLLMDEAYHHFSDSTALPLLSRHGNLIIARTFSKAFGIAGLRLGYLISHPRNIEQLTKVRPMYETHSLAIAVAELLLEQDHLMHAYVGQVKEAVHFLIEEFNHIGLRTHGGASNFILLALPKTHPSREVAASLKELGFLVRAEATAPLSNHLRITVGDKPQAIRFLEAFKKSVATFQEGQPTLPVGELRR